MNKDKSIDWLNSLVQINNDRIAGYTTAADETEERSLKELFGQLRETSEEFNKQLIPEVKALGGEPVTGTMTSGKLYRAWMDVKAALTGKDKLAIMNSCEFGEDMAVATYKKVIEDSQSDLSADLYTLISEQFTMLKSDHDSVKALRDSLKKDK